MCLVVMFSPRTLIFFCACDFNSHLTLPNQNPIFVYTRSITLKHVMSLRAHLRVIAPKQHCSFRRNVAAGASRWQYCLTGLARDLTSRSIEERVTG